MPTVQIKGKLTPEELLRVVGQLSEAELDQFAARVLALRARRRAPVLDQRESELLETINRGLPRPLVERHDSLAERRDREVLSPEEHAELLEMTGEIERIQADRIEALVELAHLRTQSLDDLLRSLGLTTPTDAA